MSFDLRGIKTGGIDVGRLVGYVAGYIPKC